MSVAAEPKKLRIEQIVELSAERLDVEHEGVIGVELTAFDCADGPPIQVSAPTLIEAMRLLRVRALRRLADLIEAGEQP